MRAPIAYFAGAGTVIAAIGLGLGGGFTIANVMSPHQDKLEQTKLEQRMAAKPIPPSAEADQPKQQAEQAKPAVPYVAATNAAINANAAPAPSQPQTQAPAPQPAETRVANDPPAKPAEPQIAKTQAAPHEQAASSSDDANARDTDKARSREDANASARDSDLKRLAAEKRKAERRQQWLDRKKAQQQQRDAELRDVDTAAPRDADAPRVLRRDPDGPRIVRRDTDGPRVVVQDDDDSDRRGDFDRRNRGDRPFGFPMFNLFGGDRND